MCSLWVADMAFRVLEPVLDALRKAVDHGIFGYSEVKPGHNEALFRCFLEPFGWQTQPDWLVKIPSVVFALTMTRITA